MSTVAETQSHRERTVIYVVAGIVTVVLIVLGLILFSSAKDDREAQDKADKLIAAVAATGATPPDRDQVVRVLGTDGGATCEDPSAALSRATLYSQLANGAAGPGQRPVIADRSLLRAQLLIVKVYCPDELEDFQAHIDKLKTDDVAS